MGCRRAVIGLGLVCVVTVAGCSVAASDKNVDDPSCEGGNCDEKNPEISEECSWRREIAAVDKAYRDGAIHWGCSNGRNTYCEPHLFIELSGSIREIDDVSTLTDDEIFELEDLFSEAVGRCVITTWLGDAGSLPTCPDGSDCLLGTNGDLGADRGVALSTFVTREPQNQLSSLTNLLQTCHAAPGPTQKADAYDEGCSVADALLGARGWLPSEISNANICAGMSSLWDCGCTEPEAVETSLLAGFYGPRLAAALGTQIDFKCERINDQMISCPITAEDVLNGGADRCMDIYGHNLEASIEIPLSAFDSCPADALSTCGAWQL